jgi:hypothetical protein
MNRWSAIFTAWWLALGLATALGAPSTVWSAEGDEQAATQLDEEANSPDGAQHVTQRLTQEFGVEEARITSLREKNLGYGEIHHALSLARQMPGGITDDNVNSIMQMRQDQHMGWGKIAQELGTKLGPATKPVSSPQASTPPAEAPPTVSGAEPAPAQSPIRPGSSGGKEKNAKGRGWFGLGRGAAGVERPGGGKANGLRGSSSHTTGVGHGGGLNEGGGKSSLAPGHNR